MDILGGEGTCQECKKTQEWTEFWAVSWAVCNMLELSSRFWNGALSSTVLQRTRSKKLTGEEQSITSSISSCSDRCPTVRGGMAAHLIPTLLIAYWSRNKMIHLFILVPRTSHSTDQLNGISWTRNSNGGNITDKNTWVYSEQRRHEASIVNSQ